MEQERLLSGATVYLILNGGRANNNSNNTTAQQEKITLYQTIVESLGGQLTATLEDDAAATHALWIRNDDDELEEDNYTQNIECSLAKSLNIPVVDAKRWLDRVSVLTGDEHWSDIDCAAYTPQLRKRDLFMAESLSQTLQILSLADPNFVEENALKRAMELSLLDCALVVRKVRNNETNNNCLKNESESSSPHQVLGIPPTASFAEIKKAYRTLARLNHPDKGGSAASFERIARAYQSLLVTPSSLDESRIVFSDKFKPTSALKGTAHWDSELKDHHRLVQELFTSHGANLTQNVALQADVLKSMGLQAQDIGSTNVNERNETIHNSCFYLSLAASYLVGIGAVDSVIIDNNNNSSCLFDEDIYLIKQTALHFKRFIEAAVVAAHPEWVASNQVGEEVQAYSDFLVYLLDSPDSMMSDWAVVVFDTTSGVCDIYKGKFYDQIINTDGKAANTITIQYLPEHYQPLFPTNTNNDNNNDNQMEQRQRRQRRPCLDQIVETLDKHKVLYVVTDGSA